MSGGKGGSQSTQVTIPPFIEAAAKENLRRAQKTAGMGYLPYYGPEVAALSPMQKQAMSATGGAAQAFGLAGPEFDPLAGIPRADFYDGGLRGYGSSGLFEESLGELATRSPTQFAAYGNLPTLTPPTPGAPPAPVDPGYFPAPGSGESVGTYPYGNPLQPGGGADFNGYPPGFGGMVDFFDPELSSAAGGRGISPYIQDLQDQIDQLSARPAFDPTGLEQQIADLQERPAFDPSGLQQQIAGLEGQFSQFQPFDPTALQQQIAELRGQPQFDPSGLQQRLAGLEGQFSQFQPFDPSNIQQQIAEAAWP